MGIDCPKAGSGSGHGMESLKLTLYVFCQLETRGSVKSGGSANCRRLSSNTRKGCVPLEGRSSQKSFTAIDPSSKVPLGRCRSDPSYDAPSRSVTMLLSFDRFSRSCLRIDFAAEGLNKTDRKST